MAANRTRTRFSREISVKSIWKTILRCVAPAIVLVAVLSGCDILGAVFGDDSEYAAIEGVRAEYQQDGSILITWQAHEDIDRVDIWMAQGQASDFQSLASAWNSNSYVHSELQANTTYFYQVRAIRGDVYGDFSETVSATTPFGGGGGGTDSSGGDQELYQLNNWQFFNSDEGAVLWYFFQASPGATYEIQFKDATDGEMDDTADIRVSVYHEDRSTTYAGLVGLDSGYTVEHTLVVPAGQARVYLKVEVLQTGSFGIRPNTITTSNESRLASIEVEDGIYSLSPAFDSDVFSYSLVVSSSFSTLDFGQVWGVDFNAEIVVTVDGTQVPFSAGQFSATGMTPGVQSVIVITSTASDGSSTNSYTITVDLVSGNGNMASLAISEGALSPAFDIDEHFYSVLVDATVSQIAVTPIAEDTDASILVNGVPVASGSLSASETLGFGLNEDILYVEIEAPDGSNSSSYYIDVTRSLTGDFDLVVGNAIDVIYDEGQKEYTVELETSASSALLEITPVDNTAAILVDGVSGSPRSIAISNGAYTETVVPVVITPNGGAGTPESFTVRLVTSWTADSPGDQPTLWYGFTAVSGTDYRVQWDDLINGSGTFPADVVVSGYHQDQTTLYSGFDTINSGYSAPVTFSATSSETVYLRVRSLDGGNVGNFGIRVFDVTNSTWVTFMSVGNTVIVR
jgi:hypothetical protein